MPLTVITLKSVPNSLRGDLTRWMQEISTGVYIGNFNSKIRENLWERVKESVNGGEATLTYASRNEIGYLFDSINTDRELVDFDGIPLVLIPIKKDSQSKRKLGFSNAAKLRKAHKYNKRYNKRNVRECEYIVIDIETDGIDINENSIIELGAYKVNGIENKEFDCLIKYDGKLPYKIKKLTGISDEMLQNEGIAIEEGLKSFLEFIGDYDLLGYSVDFDIRFINNNLSKIGLPLLKNKRYDLMKYVKKEKMFLSNYKLQTVLKEYGIEKIVPHRALLDCKLIYDLSYKVKKFRDFFE